ncbi:hypothetical protein BDV26DRAFT_39474 [Aspergillus bertholletiae]|uniref:Uncharacterized protein n=1 Tax=Aspergillus bertholletiae TaxID=1226010 RepID=A0A5N7BK70_9EURO|nr:hypothetical protein BDV26DRAFT_39474 [Aspergillus bertholletiae]
MWSLVALISALSLSVLVWNAVWTTDQGPLMSLVELSVPTVIIFFLISSFFFVFTLLVPSLSLSYHLYSVWSTDVAIIVLLSHSLGFLRLFYYWGGVSFHPFVSNTSVTISLSPLLSF